MSSITKIVNSTNRARTQFGIWSVEFEVARSLNVNDTIDDDMADMDALGTEFSCQRLRQSSNAKLARSEG